MIVLASILVSFALAALALGLYSVGRSGQLDKISRRLGEPSRGGGDQLDTSIFRQERLSSIGLVSRLLGRLHFARHMERMMQKAGLTMNVSTFALITLAAFGTVWTAARFLFHHNLLALFLGVLGATIPYVVVLIKMNRRIALFSEQFPDAIDMITNALRAGFAMNGAIQMVAEESPDPVGTEFKILYEEQKLGLDLKQALLNFGKRMDTTDVPIFVTAVLIQRDTGGNLAEVLENIAYVIRDRYRILGEVRTFTTQGRMSGVILGLLPVIMAGVLSILSPGYLEHMTGDQLGSVLITVAVILQVVGFFWIRKVVNIKI
jgi:tight adherence protein B